MAPVQLDKDDADGDQQYDRNADQDPKATRRVRLNEPVEGGETEIRGAVDGSYRERSEGKDAHGPVADPDIPLPPRCKLRTKASNRAFDSEN